MVEAVLALVAYIHDGAADEPPAYNKYPDVP
jgi:hypothetical protein